MMSDPLKTILLEYDKSTFNISLFRHETGNCYLQIEQVIHVNDKLNEFHKIKIDPTILDEIIEALKLLNPEISGLKNSGKGYFSLEQKREIQRRFLKGGITPQDLALQFSCSDNIIEQILRNSGIEVIDNSFPKEAEQTKKGNYKKKRSRR